MEKNRLFQGYQSALARVHKAADIAAIVISGIISAFLFFDVTDVSHSIILTSVIMFVMAFYLYDVVGLYRPWRGERKSREVATITVAWTVVFILAGAISFTIGFISEDEKKILITWYVIGVLSSVLSRLIVRIVLNHIRSKGYNIKNIIIIGDDDSTRSVIKRIRYSKWTGYRILGYFGDSEERMPAKKLGDYNDISQYMENNSDNIEQVWIALPFSDALLVQKIIRSLDCFVVDIRYAPDLDGFDLINHSVSMVSGMPVINLSSTPMYGFNRVIKAIEDRVIAGLILLLISPLMLILALGVKLTSVGPVFYKQERVGWNGKPFYMLKFRSMPVDTESKGVQWGNASKKANTKFGKFIRSTSLDELPQFINVIVGDMSIVGPRPERTVFVDEFKTKIPGYMKKHMVKAGITGWAQINGWRGDTDLNKRIECDLEYIQNWSLIWDLKIIFMTLYKGFIHKNAG